MGCGFTETGIDFPPPLTISHYVLAPDPLYLHGMQEFTFENQICNAPLKPDRQTLLSSQNAAPMQRTRLTMFFAETYPNPSALSL